MDAYIIVTTLCDKEEIENEIKKIHDYETAEISYSEIKGANKEFLDWIEQNLYND